MSTQDPNAAIRNAANAYLLLREESGWREFSMHDFQQMEKHLETIHRWFEVTRDVLAAKVAFDKATAAYEKDVPERIVKL